MTETQRIAAVAWEIALDARANRIEKLSALGILCACRGIVVGEIREEWLPPKQIVQLRDIRRKLIERVLRKKAVRKRQNRKAYIRRKIRAIETAQEAGVRTDT
jgi:hypothetical protein